MRYVATYVFVYFLFVFWMFTESGIDKSSDNTARKRYRRGRKCRILVKSISSGFFFSSRRPTTVRRSYLKYFQRFAWNAKGRSPKRYLSVLKQKSTLSGRIATWRGFFTVLVDESSSVSTTSPYKLPKRFTVLQSKWYYRFPNCRRPLADVEKFTIP